MMNDPFNYQTPDPQFEPVNLKPNGHAQGYSTASLVLGIIALFSNCCCCCGSPVAVVCGILAIVFAFLSKRDNLGKMPGKSTAGLICGIIGIVIAIIVVLAIFSLRSTPEFREEYQKMYEEIYKNAYGQIGE